VAKWSQFHNWVIVASLANFGKGSSFGVKSLVEHLPQNDFFAHLLQRKWRCIGELKAPNQVVGPKFLLRNLLLQMDNYVKYNKNCYLLTFLSLLTTKEVFEEVKFRIFVVGHTHEDIDGCFGYLSKNLKKQNNYILVDLMKAFMASQEQPFIS